MNKAFRQHNFLKKIKAEFANWKLNDFSSFSMATLVLWVVYNENAMRMCCRHWNMKWAKLNASYLTVVDSFTYRWNNIHGGWVTTSSYLSLREFEICRTVTRTHTRICTTKRFIFAKPTAYRQSFSDIW